MMVNAPHTTVILFLIIADAALSGRSLGRIVPVRCAEGPDSQTPIDADLPPSMPGKVASGGPDERGRAFPCKTLCSA
jgi:hypothetical protein